MNVYCGKLQKTSSIKINEALLHKMTSASVYGGIKKTLLLDMKKVPFCSLFIVIVESIVINIKLLTKIPKLGPAFKNMGWEQIVNIKKVKLTNLLKIFLKT